MQPGNRDNFSGDLELVAPTGGVVRGKIYTIEDAQVVARATADAGDSFLAAVSGSVVAEKATGTGKDFAVGEDVFAVSNVADKDATGAVYLGKCLRAAGASDDAIFVEIVLAEDD